MPQCSIFLNLKLFSFKEWPVTFEISSQTQLQEDEAESNTTRGPKQHRPIWPGKRLCERQSQQSSRRPLHVFVVAEPEYACAVAAPTVHPQRSQQPERRSQFNPPRPKSAVPIQHQITENVCQRIVRLLWMTSRNDAGFSQPTKDALL